jgi:hypothetical protein
LRNSGVPTPAVLLTLPRQYSHSSRLLSRSFLVANCFINFPIRQEESI